MIELVTFTGVDETTPAEALLELAAKYPFCEFAILAGTRTGTLPRFPPVETIGVELQRIAPITDLPASGPEAPYDNAVSTLLTGPEAGGLFEIVAR